MGGGVKACMAASLGENDAGGGPAHGAVPFAAAARLRTEPTPKKWALGAKKPRRGVSMAVKSNRSREKTREGRGDGAIRGARRLLCGAP